MDIKPPPQTSLFICLNYFEFSFLAILFWICYFWCDKEIKCGVISTETGGLVEEIMFFVAVNNASGFFYICSTLTGGQHMFRDYTVFVLRQITDFSMAEITLSWSLILFLILGVVVSSILLFNFTVISFAALAWANSIRCCDNLFRREIMFAWCS